MGRALAFRVYVLGVSVRAMLILAAMDIFPLRL